MRPSALLTLAVAVAACGGKKESPAAAPPSSGTAAAAPVDAAPPPPPPAPIDQAAVDQLLADWLAAQNGGDFAAYEQLYAERMEGVKRVGARMWRFDRAGWMADRKKMFGKPMVVTAADRTITGSVAAPVVEFTQTYQQARFADAGKKRMVLTRHQGHYRIAREEMLVSTVGAPPAAIAGAILPTVEIDGRWFAVLAADADPTWATGAIAGPYQGVHRYALRGASAAPTAGSWLGKPLALYDRAGARCDATVAALHLLGGGTPHFGEIQAWDGPDAGGDHVFTPAERARAIYDLGGKYLVGELTVPAGCKPAYAAAPDRTLVTYGEVALADASKTAAVTAFRKLPGYADTAAEFAAQGGTGEWAPTPTVTAFGPPDRRVLVVEASEGAGCGDFHGELTAVFDERAGALTRRAVFSPSALRVDAVVDSDGDGAPELVGAPNDFETVTAHIVPAPTGFQVVSGLRLPFTDCGC